MDLTKFEGSGLRGGRKEGVSKVYEEREKERKENVHAQTADDQLTVQDK